MRANVVFRVDMSDDVMLIDEDVSLSERETSEETEIESEFPEIFMSVRLRVPPV